MDDMSETFNQTVNTEVRPWKWTSQIKERREWLRI